MKNTWAEGLSYKLDMFGHRNWVLVTDKAYPLQNSQGIVMLDSGEELPDTLKEVLDIIDQKKHIKPLIYVDKELDFLNDSFCPGISRLRNDLKSVLSSCPNLIQTVPHEDIIQRLNEKSKLFNIIVVKTETILPYTSVFIELNCGYWSELQENLLRGLMLP